MLFFVHDVSLLFTSFNVLNIMQITNVLLCEDFLTLLFSILTYIHALPS